jgi:DNA/RNA-binding domain of Phe-tRNA-synthetase-like protein
LRRLIKGEDFPTISKAVDAYLLTETVYYLPVGGYDFDHLSGDVVLRFSPGGEPFTPIGGRESEVTREGEVVYADEARVLTRKWNFRDCDECKITDASRNIVLFTEAPFGTVETTRLVESIEHMASAIRQHCGGNVTTHLLDGVNELTLAA